MACQCMAVETIMLYANKKQGPIFMAKTLARQKDAAMKPRKHVGERTLEDWLEDSMEWWGPVLDYDLAIGGLIFSDGTWDRPISHRKWERLKSMADDLKPMGVLDGEFSVWDRRDGKRRWLPNLSTEVSNFLWELHQLAGESPEQILEQMGHRHLRHTEGEPKWKSKKKPKE